MTPLNPGKKFNQSMSANRNFRPGQFGIFTLAESANLNETITRELPKLMHLRLKSIEWIDLGSQITAILCSSFRSQIYLSEWMDIFKCLFTNTIDSDRLRENSKRVVKMIADARQLNPMSINHFQVQNLPFYHCLHFWQKE